MTIVHSAFVHPRSVPRPSTGSEASLDYVAGPLNKDIIGERARDHSSVEEHSWVPQRWGSKSGHSLPAAPTLAPATRSATRKFRQLLGSEFAGLHPRLTIARMLLAPLPIHVGGRLRSAILRLIGFRIGRGTIMASTPTITCDGHMYDKLVIGTDCWINIGCVFDLGAEIRIGNHVSIGHEVMVLTQSHDVGPASRRAFTAHARPINIGSGVWLGSRTTILPGVTIGSGAVVAAGSVVCHDVPSNTLVAGVPARAVKHLS